MRQYLRPFFENRLFFYGLLLINIFGTGYGFWWYRGQFAQTPRYLWPFVPNSPLAVMYFFIVLWLILNKKRSVFWEGLAYFGLIKHGLWTVAIISIYELSGRTSPDNFGLWFGHGGMALQAVLFWYYYGLPLRYSHAFGLSAWYLFNDYLDYGVGIYPWVDTTAITIPTIRTIAITYSVALALLFFYTAWRHQRKETT